MAEPKSGCAHGNGHLRGRASFPPGLRFLSQRIPEEPHGRSLAGGVASSLLDEGQPFAGLRWTNQLTVPSLYVSSLHGFSVYVGECDFLGHLLSSGAGSQRKMIRPWALLAV